jgi:predicted phage tail protein
MYLAVRLAACLDEENPLGRVLIGWGGVPLLAGAKMAGTVLVLGVLSHLWHAWRRAAWAAAFALAAVQAAVVLYLHLA